MAGHVDLHPVRKLLPELRAAFDIREEESKRA